MALSQCLEDSPLRFAPRRADAAELNPQEVYNERHRLALEELLSGGVDDFLGFLGRERIPNFLSDDEIQQLWSAAVPARHLSLDPNHPGLSEEAAVSTTVGDSSADCSSVTYFPEVSDVEPPVLELGWPAFTAGSYRGVTRAVAHFQPSYGESIYSCKEAARRMIKNAKEVIAIVTDSLTDLDIFKDLQEACSLRRVPVYILLDQSCAPAFLKMCRNVGVRLDDLRQMRVRTITGTTYYMRSGARITGNVHERFMLVDGNRVATGSYRFNWSDGRLNSSNLIELSGQITEKFDEEFRILYAQSLPINTRGPPSVRNSAVYEHLLLKHAATFSPQVTRERPTEQACATSTPSRKTLMLLEAQPPSPVCRKFQPASDEGWTEQKVEILAGNAARPSPAENEPETPGVTRCHASTQTSPSAMDRHAPADLRRSSPSPRRISSASDSALKDCFHKLTAERQHHYQAIRSKLEHMVTALSERRELADITNVAQGLGGGGGGGGRGVRQKDCEQEANQRLPVDGMGTWPRARCAQ
ncbi:unnamed protein product [Ophioblennius macclurei]